MDALLDLDDGACCYYFLEWSLLEEGHFCFLKTEIFAQCAPFNVLARPWPTDRQQAGCHPRSSHHHNNLHPRKKMLTMPAVALPCVFF